MDERSRVLPPQETPAARRCGRAPPRPHAAAVAGCHGVLPEAPDADLPSAPAPRRAAGGVAWRAFGADPSGLAPLILFHGGAGSWEHWVANVGALSGSFRVIALDLPGYGDSDAPPESLDKAGYLGQVTRAVEDILASVGHDGGAGVHLAGFSFGAVVAAHTALALGPRAAALAVVGAAGFGPPVGRSFTLISRQRLARLLGRAPTAAEIARMHAENLARLMIWDRARIDRRAVAMQWRNVERTRFDSRRISWTSALPELVARLACPVMAVYGEHDAAAIPPVAERFDLLRRARADIRCEVVAAAGHWALYERPAVLDRLLLEFFRGAADGSGQRPAVCSAREESR